MTPTIKTPVDVLRAARKLIEKEENWIQYLEARDVYGSEVSFSSDEAVCFCSIGALRRSTWDLTVKLQQSENYHQVARQATKYLVDALPERPAREGYWGVSIYTDSHTHADNLTLFDKAITLAERDYASAS